VVPFWLCGSGADVVCRETAHRGHCRADRCVHSGKMFYSLSFRVFEYTRTAKMYPSYVFHCHLITFPTLPVLKPPAFLLVTLWGLASSSVQGYISAQPGPTHTSLYYLTTISLLLSTVTTLHAHYHTFCHSG
jgi:hypothetical protein